MKYVLSATIAIVNKKNEPDLNIIKALKELPVPLTNFKDRKILFNLNKRKESIYEHIAVKSHHLHVSDIKVIPSILKNPKSLVSDHDNRKGKIYIGRRGKKHENVKYLKIVTQCNPDSTESIITIYLTKNRR